MELPERDGDGYLIDSSVWTPEISRAMAQADGVELDDARWQQILKAREYYEDHAVVPGRRPEADVQNVDDRPDEADHKVRGAAQANWLCLNANDDLKGTSLRRVPRSQHDVVKWLYIPTTATHK
jgi:tRNA 2-thiouridine synthesizing protein E